MDSALLAAIPLISLVGATGVGGIALLSARAGRPLASERTVAALACGASALALAASIALAIRAGGGIVEGPSVPWLDVAEFAGPIALRIDALSTVLLLVVTGIGFLIHVYSAAYMHGDPGYARYFAYLNLFLFFMTGLVLSANLVSLFIGWEGVGLCSYLLIGFWWEDPEKARAGMKAFVVNRIGDSAFILGILLLYKIAGTVDFLGIDSALEARPDLFGAKVMGGVSVASAASLLLFFGACGKSAQIPLHVWLPDAMAGPTPVSALIHAATMVTAGVYMVCRLSALYAAAPFASAVVALVGAVTALFAASIALVQTDLKKVLAYSTVSQLGLMFLGAGVGATAAAMFHLVTHAFFKACLFLGAGSVIHALGGEQDIRRMGGIRWKMPITGITFVVAALALSGIPPLAGYFSKDAILWGALSRGGEFSAAFGFLLWGLGIATAACTAFYAFRVVYLVFYGRPRCSEAEWQHLHESPARMTVVLVLLAVGSAVAGFIDVPRTLARGMDFLDQFVAMSLAGGGTAGEGLPSVELAIGFVALLVASAGGLTALLLYREKPGLMAELAARFPRLHALLSAKYRVDELYEAAIVRPLTWIGDRAMSRTIDGKIIDGIANGLATFARAASVMLRLFQTGVVRTYVAILLLGAIAVLYAFWGGSIP